MLQLCQPLPERLVRRRQLHDPRVLLNNPRVLLNNPRGLRPGQRGCIQEVNDADPAFLRYLAAQGLVPGVEFEVVDYSPYDENLRIRIADGGAELVLGASVTSQIQVKVLE